MEKQTENRWQETEEKTEEEGGKELVNGDSVIGSERECKFIRIQANTLI